MTVHDIRRVLEQSDGLDQTRAGRVAHKALTTAEWCALDRANATALGALAVLLIVAVYRMVRV